MLQSIIKGAYSVNKQRVLHTKILSDTTNNQGRGYPLTDPLAEGFPHTTLGRRYGSDRICYRQSATFPSSTWPKANGYDVPWGRVDWTDHDRPSDHPNPHIHEFRYNWEQKRWEFGLPKFWWYRRDVD